MSTTREERDSLGTVHVPADAYYGAQTQRAKENFPISGRGMPRRFIEALGIIKAAAAAVHRETGDTPREMADAIERAAREVVDRQLSVRATEALVKKARAGDRPSKPREAARPKSASVRDLEERLTRSLGGPVTITEDEPGKAGRIEIRYLDLDHLERLLDRLL